MNATQWEKVIERARGIVEANGQAVEVGPMLEAVRGLVDPIDERLLDTDNTAAREAAKVDEVAALKKRLAEIE